MRALDWNQTPLGPPASWPQSLKTIVRVMLDSRYAMWMLWGSELTFFCNDAYLPTVGLKRDWVLGARSDKVWEEIWPDIGPRIAQVLELGRATWDEALLLFLERRGFREETYHTFSYSPVYDDGNRIAGMLCVVTEVTKRTIGEQRLRTLAALGAGAREAATAREACERAARILEQSTADVPFSLLYLLDDSGTRAERVATSSLETDHPAAPASVALDAEGALWPFGRAAKGPLLVDLDPDTFDALPAGPWPEAAKQALVMPLLVAGETAAAGFVVAGVSTRRPLDVEYRSFFDLMTGHIATAVTNARALEEERERAAALAELDRAKTIFFSNVSHEFRTPLTLMLGPIEAAANDPETRPSVRKQLELAHRNSLRLLKLVNSLLDFSRIEAGRMRASYEPTELATLTRDLASNFHSAIERAGLEFFVECAPIGEQVYLDREMWEKIVLNLLSNAFKFTLAGSITVRLRGDDAHAVLEVTDTGIGIPPAELPRLFERFHRIENTQARTHEGSGIGLALVQELVKLHGGTIVAVSEPGRGTTFRVRIPFGSAHLPAARVKAAPASAATAIGAQAFVQEALRWLPETESAAAIAPANPMLADSTTPVLDRRFAATFGSRIVVADDNADMRAYLRELLAPYYSVVAAVDGVAALEALRAEPADLLLSDIMMPRLDGFGLLKALRQDENLRETPVILLSARAGEESRIEGLEAGADDYLVKPFSARELLARVGALLELMELRREREEALSRAHAELRESEEALREADRRKSEFIALLGHELRNPLSPIHTAGELLSRTLEPGSRAQVATDMIRRQTAHLTRLVDDLLDIGRITQGRIQLERKPIDLSSVIAQAVETIEPQLREKRHQISIVTSSSLPLYVNGDFARLVQCMVNVLSNAVKYSDAGGTIRVETRAEREMAVIEISDTGVGIPTELLPRIFDLFVQSERTLDRAEGGLGIGLSVVKRLIEMHEGEVTARSEGLGHGSTFELRVPRTARPEVLSSDGVPVRAPPRRVLIVDDNVDAANSLAMLLGVEGHEAQVAYGSREALERIEAFRPDVALLDIGLPEIDGYELARRLRSIPHLKALRLVALTGYGQPEDHQRSRAAGFEDHLVKPVDPPSLQRALAGVGRTRGRGSIQETAR